MQEAAGAAGVPVAATGSATSPTRRSSACRSWPCPSWPAPIPVGLHRRPTRGSPACPTTRRAGRCGTSFVDALVAIHAADVAGLGLRTRSGRASSTGGTRTSAGPPTARRRPRSREALAWCRGEPSDRRAAGRRCCGATCGSATSCSTRDLRPRAVLDWDMASVGPIEMDLAWFLALEALQARPHRHDRRRVRRPATTRSPGPRQRAGRPLRDLDWHEMFALVRASAVATRLAVLFERAGQRSMFRIGEDPTPRGRRGSDRMTNRSCGRD